MSSMIKVIPRGTVTSPAGFVAGATYAGLKTKGSLDLAILYSPTPCTTAGVFTTNKIKAASVVLSQKRLAKGKAQAIIVNSGCANACTGEDGLADAGEMASVTGRKLGISPHKVLVASTGVIGVRLPMEALCDGISRITLSPQGGHKLARAIMTTDTRPKEIALSVEHNDAKFTIGGVAKGAGMIHPNMATMLAFLTTDAVVNGTFLQSALRQAVDSSFNMITIDGDTSPNDTVLLMANGKAGNAPIKAGSPLAGAFQAALEKVCVYLARSIARDGEGATRLIEVKVEGAADLADARSIARTVAGSPLVKTAVHGCDPNWGRIVAAVGRSGAEVVESRIDLFLEGIPLMKAGRPLPFDKGEASAALSRPEVSIRICLNLGEGKATAWGCDLSAEYVTINSAYTT